MSKEYAEFQKFIYDDIIREWTKAKLSYIISKHNIDLVMKRDPTLTIQQIMEDFRKHPSISEVFMSLEQIVLLPK